MAAETSMGMKRETAARLDALSEALGLRSKEATVCRLMAMHELEAVRSAHPEASPHWDSARSLSRHADDAFAALVAEYDEELKRAAAEAENRLSLLTASLESARSDLASEKKRAASLEQELRAAAAEASREREAKLRAEERAEGLASRLETMRSLEEIVGIMRKAARPDGADGAHAAVGSDR